MIDLYQATVVFPGKAFDDTYNPGQKKVSATFLPAGRADTKENQVRVNAREGSDKAKRLLALRKGETAWLAYVPKGDKSYHDIVRLHGAGPVANGHAPTPGPTAKRPGGDEAKRLALLYWQVANEITSVYGALSPEQKAVATDYLPGPAEVQKLASTLYISQDRR